MPKHKKKNLQQLIQKRQQLQHVIAGTAEFTAVINPSLAAVTVPQTPLAEVSTETHHAKEITHTLLSLVIIVILLGISLYLNHRTIYFSQFGNWLYTVLRLKN